MDNPENDPWACKWTLEEKTVGRSARWCKDFEIKKEQKPQMIILGIIGPLENYVVAVDPAGASVMPACLAYLSPLLVTSL